jgi:galactoside O-acetyltransferase
MRILKRIIRKLRRSTHKVSSGFPNDSWEKYKDYVRIHPTAIIDPSASLKIFNPPSPPEVCLEIGEGSHIFSSFSLLRPQSRIRIGKRCQLGNSTFICAQSIEVGDDVIMAWGCTVIDSDNHSLYWSERRFDVERCRMDYIKTNGFDLARSHDWSTVQVGKVLIGSKSWIGFNVIILKKVFVGEGAIVGAGSVIARNIEPWNIVAGNPFRIIRKVSQSREQDI